MSKKLVLCCDGTSNQPATDLTNVAKLYFTLQSGDAPQATYYHPGLGTMEPPGALSWWDKTWTTKLGLAAGWGIQNDIRDAYIFLMNNYEPGDDVFMFGFSRGAYTVRALTGLLHMYGLIRPGNEPLVPYVVRMMFAINKATKRNDENTVKEVFHLANRFKSTFSHACQPHFVGLWDTVSSVGWFAHPTKLPYTANNPDIAIARHAIAIDERRAFFPPNLWRPSTEGLSGPRDLKQVWFPGSHSDVGGGYPEGPESAQSKYALEWMLNEAGSAGLLIDKTRASEILGLTPNTRYQKASVQYAVHESLTPAWWATEFLPKPYYDYKRQTETLRANLFRHRIIPEGAFVHKSAYMRGESYLGRLPKNNIEVS
jgi:uncharacterized protein (DUF2235 family)